MNFSAFIPSAGFGTRMGYLTKSLPKPMLPLAGRPLIDHILFCLTEWECSRAAVNTHYLPEFIENHLRNFIEFPIVISSEKPEILLSGGGIRTALHLLQENNPIVVMNPDTIYLPDSVDHPFSLPFPETEWDSVLYLKKKPTDFKGNSFRSMNENHTFPVDMNPNYEYYYTGYAVINPIFINNFPVNTPFDIVPLWKKSAKEGRLFGRIFSGSLIDCGTGEDYDLIKDTIPYDNGKYDRWQNFIKTAFY